VYGVVVTNNGGSVYAQTKRFDSVMTGTHDAEGRATLAGTDVILRLRNVQRAMGCLDADAATVVGTDCLSNYQMAMQLAVPGRTKHILRRWKLVQERIAEGDVVLVHVPDAGMPADFLTKWLPRKKLEASLARASNFVNALPAAGPTEA